MLKGKLLQGHTLTLTVNHLVAAPRSTTTSAVARECELSIWTHKVEQLNRTEAAITGFCREWPDCCQMLWYQTVKQFSSTLLSHVNLYRKEKNMKKYRVWAERYREHEDKEIALSLYRHCACWETNCWSTGKRAGVNCAHARGLKKLQTRNLIPIIQPQNGWTEGAWMFTCAKSTSANSSD